MNALERSLARVFRGSHSLDAGAPGRATVFAGVETRNDFAAYRWDGMKRGGDPQRPRALFQYTLSGCGAFAAAGRAQRVEPGQGFVARIPSKHRYGLVGPGKPWRFFFVLVEHPDLLRRWGAAGPAWNTVASIGPGDPPIAAALALMEVAAKGASADPWELECAAYRWWMTWERWARLGGGGGRERVLAETAAAVLGDLSRPAGVQELAAARGMSRTGFTHWFRKVTGLAPAAFVRDLRLDEAARRLRAGRDGLAAIAAECGFADANHLCKAFRRRFAMSPGRYRASF